MACRSRSHSTTCVPSLLFAGWVFCSRLGGAAATSVQWSGDLRNLDFSAMEEQQVEQLSASYASDVAHALGVQLVDITDLQGHPGHVSLGLPTDPALTFASTTESSKQEHSTSPTSTTTVARTTTVTSTATSTSTSTFPMRPLSPWRGIAYGALPCTTHDCGGQARPSEDMLLEAYEKQWGAEGRNDLGVMASLGANTVRLYHSLGLDHKEDHGKFLDRAQVVGLNVMPGYHTDAVHGGCPKFDCYNTWRKATLQGFDVGFRHGDGWHPAISALILLNEPDFFGGFASCEDGGAWCRVKAVLSALDGVLAAEREAGVEAGRVRLTVTWSFGMMPSIDGEESGAGVFGFQDTIAGIANPQLAKYTPRTPQAELERAFRTRWVHGLNTQAPWTYVKQMISEKYSKFSPIPWFIGEYGANGQPAATIQSDLEDMQRTAEEGTGFLGAAFFQFQTAYFKGGSELNFGLFSLGSHVLGDVVLPCKSSHCPSWPVHCLSTSLSWLPGTMAHRAQAVSAAWNGSLEGHGGLCQDSSSSSSVSRHSTTMTTTEKMPTEEVTAVASTTTQVAVTAGTTSRVHTGELPEMGPLRGVAYGALPCTSQACGKTGWVSEDMMQEAYSKQWGADGRDDLGTMARLGANAVRLYHSLGLDVQHDHGGFLDHAQSIGLNVMPGYHTELVHTGCPKFDCFKAWKQATLQGFKFGFKQGDQWHPAISALILLNEPDFFGSDPMCKPTGAWCRVKAMLSALDGLLAAEREVGVEAGRVKLTVTWSFGMMPSIDGKESGPGLFGFQDTVAGIADPAIAHYTPRSSQAELEHAFKTRWVHGVNTQAPWSFVKDVIAKKYTFSPFRWFIGEYGANGQPAATIESDLEDMQRTAEEEGSDFLGAAFFQFQTAHFKGGSELNFGMFRLGSKKLWDIHPPCNEEPSHRCPTVWPVYCLSTDLDWLPNTLGHRAQAVAAAWKGSLPSGPGICKGRRRLSGAEPANSTRLACRIHTSPGRTALDIESRLKDDAFSKNLIRSTRAVLGNSSVAFLGELALDSDSMFVGSESSEDGSATEGPVAKSWIAKWLPQILAAALLLAAGGLACCGFMAYKNKKAGQVESNDESANSV